jgi:hypothetical protein
MTNQEIIDSVLEVGDETLSEYETQYQTPEETDTYNYFLIGFILILLYGSRRLKRPTIYLDPTVKKQILKNNPNLAKLFKGNTLKMDKTAKDTLLSIFGTDYRGVRYTTNNRLEALKKELKKKKLSLEDLKKFNKERNKQLRDANDNIIYQNGTALLAEVDGLGYVSAITRRDGRVRPSHKAHDGKYWKVGSYSPWNDYNCRCTYTFYNKKSEIKGFSNLTK